MCRLFTKIWEKSRKIINYVKKRRKVRYFFARWKVILYKDLYAFLNSTMIFEMISFCVTVRDTQSEKSDFCSSVSSTASEPSQKNWDREIPKPSQSVWTVDMVGVVERLSILESVDVGIFASFARRYMVQPLSFMR